MTAAIAPIPLTVEPRATAPAASAPAPAQRRTPRLVPVPDCDPPFDDEIAGAPQRVGNPLRLGYAQRAPTFGPTTIVAPEVPSWSSESDVGVRRTGTGDLPAAQRAASVLARALVEVVSGRRPVAQLRVHCAPEIYAGIVARPTPLSTSLPHLLTVRVCEPADGVAEVGAVFRRADRVRALAFRIQGVDGRWRITALQIG